MLTDFQELFDFSKFFSGTLDRKFAKEVVTKDFTTCQTRGYML